MSKSQKCRLTAQQQRDVEQGMRSLLAEELQQALSAQTEVNVLVDGVRDEELSKELKEALLAGNETPDPPLMGLMS